MQEQVVLQRVVTEDVKFNDESKVIFITTYQRTFESKGAMNLYFNYIYENEHIYEIVDNNDCQVVTNEQIVIKNKRSPHMAYPHMKDGAVIIEKTFATKTIGNGGHYRYCEQSLSKCEMIEVLKENNIDYLVK